MGWVLRESIIKNQGGKILLNNTQNNHNTNFTMWECSYSIGTPDNFNGGGSKKMDRVCIQLFAIV